MKLQWPWEWYIQKKIKEEYEYWKSREETDRLYIESLLFIFQWKVDMENERNQ